MQRTRVETLQSAAKGACTCHGMWLQVVNDSFAANGINVADLCYDIYNSLHVGRSEVVPVIVLVGARGGEGKSVFMKALYSVCGDNYVFSKPESGNFPLMDLPGKQVAFLDDWRFDASVLSFASQCLWYDGSALPVARPQNQRGLHGHLLYRGSAPIFATSKADSMRRLREWASNNPATGHPWDANASMIPRRLKVYNFHVAIEKPARKVDYCARCFAVLVLSQAAVRGAHT